MLGLARRFVSRLGTAYAITTPRVVVPVTSAASVNAAPAGQAARDEMPPGSDIPDGEKLVFALWLERLLLADAITGIRQGDGVLLSLSEVASLLELAISVDPAGGSAQGWYLREEQRFELDAKERLVRWQGREEKVQPTLVRVEGGDILLHTTLLQAWFGIAATVDFSQLEIRLAPRQQLPLQQRIARRERLEKGRGTPAADPVLPRLVTPMRAVDIPLIDVQMDAAHRRRPGEESRTAAGYSVIAAGDLGLMSSTLFASGSQDEPLSSLRFTAERLDPDGTLLGPLKARRLAFGDVESVRLPISGGPALERGLSVTNAPFSRVGAFDTIDVTGDVQPGWDVELYRNGMLIDFKQVGDEGRYEFTDVPLFSGINELRLIFFGPQGQRLEEVRQIPIGGGMVHPGEMVYALSATQQGTNLFPDHLSTDPAPNTDSRAPRAAGIVQFGITGWLSGQAGLETASAAGQQTVFATGGVSGHALGVGMAANVTADARKGIGTDLVLSTLLLGHSFRVNYQWADDLHRPGDALTRSGSQVTAALYGFNQDFGLPVGYGLNATRTEVEAGTTTTVSGQVSAGLGRLMVSGDLAWTSQEGQSGSFDGLGSSTQVTTSVGRVRLRGRSSFDITPEFRLTGLDASAYMPFGRSLSGQIEVAHRPMQDRTYGTARLNFDTGMGVLSPRVSVDDRKSVEAVLQARFALGREPLSGDWFMTSERMAQSGAVAARVFLDENRDGRFNQGEELIEGARVRADQAFRSADSSSTGVALLSRLDPGLTTDVAIDEASLPDPFMVPSIPGYSVEPRPGRVHSMDLPVVLSSDVEGTIVERDEAGVARPVGGVEVALIDRSGRRIGGARTAFDGFYVVSKVPPGTYSLIVDPESAKARGLVQAAPRLIEVGDQGVMVAEAVTLDSVGTAAPNQQQYVLHLGSFQSAFGSRAAWVLLRNRFRPELESLAMINFDDRPAGAGYPLVVGIGDRIEGEKICGILQSQNRPCMIRQAAELVQAPDGS
jgi:hypothetical protein